MSSRKRTGGTRGPLEKSTYAIGGASKNTSKLSISRTWKNTSLNKSRVLARSMHNNNRALAKQLNRARVQLNEVEDSNTALRLENEQLRQGIRLKDAAIEELKWSIGQMAHLLVSAEKRAHDALAWPQVKPLGDTFSLEASDQTAPELPDPFLRRDRIPRTPVQNSVLEEPDMKDSGLPSIASNPILTLDQLCVPDQTCSETAAVTASAAPSPPSTSAVVPPPPAARAAAPQTVTKRKGRSHASVTNPPVSHRRETAPSTTIYDFSMSDTMNQTHQPVPSLAEIRRQSQQSAAHSEQPRQSETMKDKSTSGRVMISEKTKDSVATPERSGISETLTKKPKESKTVVGKSKGAKTTREKVKGSETASEKLKGDELTETSECAESGDSQKVSEAGEKAKVFQKTEEGKGPERGIEHGESVESEKGGKAGRKRIVRKKPGEEPEAAAVKVVKKEKAGKKAKVKHEEEPQKEVEDAEDFQNRVEEKKKRKGKRSREDEEEVKEEKENALNVIGRTARIVADAKDDVKKHRFKRLVCLDDSDDSLVLDSARKKQRKGESLETLTHAAHEKEPLADMVVLNIEAPVSGGRLRRATKVNYREPKSSGKLRQGDPNWCREDM